MRIISQREQWAFVEPEPDGPTMAELMPGYLAHPETYQEQKPVYNPDHSWVFGDDREFEELPGMPSEIAKARALQELQSRIPHDVDDLAWGT